MQWDAMGSGKLPLKRFCCQAVLTVDWRIFLEYHLHLPGEFNDPFCSIALLKIEWWYFFAANVTAEIASAFEWTGQPPNTRDVNETFFSRPRRLKVWSRRDRGETFPIFPETETRPRPSILASRRDQDRDLPFRDRDVFRDVTNGTLCQAYGFKLL